MKLDPSAVQAVLTVVAACNGEKERGYESLSLFIAAPDQEGFAQIPALETSIFTTGSLPTTQASCPGGTSAMSPGPNSSCVLSSMTTCSRPATMYSICGAWQLSVLVMGLTSFDHFQPAGSVTLPQVTPPRFTTRASPEPAGRTSSGESKLRFSMVGITPSLLLIWLLDRSTGVAFRPSSVPVRPSSAEPECSRLDSAGQAVQAGARMRSASAASIQLA